MKRKSLRVHIVANLILNKQKDNKNSIKENINLIFNFLVDNTIHLYFTIINYFFTAVFTFVSRRHRGSPFGLTILIDGIKNIRISSCCEYKHKPGFRIGGKNSQFGLISVQGAAPCYR